MTFDAVTVLYQWAVGGLFFLWVTTRRREVGLGYGWLLRSTYLVMLLGGLALAARGEFETGRDLSAGVTAVGALVALGASVVWRRAGVRGQRLTRQRRSARVAAMTGIDREEPVAVEGEREFDPRLDLLAPIAGLVTLVLAADVVGGPFWLSLLRLVVGSLFLGAVSDAMLLGHWYLVQPGLARDPIHELNKWLMIMWPVEVIAFLLPTGMLSVISGSIDDGYNGILGWFWIVCAVSTIGLSVVTKLALRERQYSAVMAATGLLYLAILTAFGTDLVARATLAP